MQILKEANISTGDLVINKLTLQFSEPVDEKRFQDDYFNKSIKIFRTTFLVAALLYAFFGWLDYTFSNDLYEDFFIIRYAIVVPFMFVVLMVSFHQKFKHVWQQLSSASFLIGGLGIMYMLYRDPENIYYYGGMFLVIIAGYFFIKLHFIWAIIPGVFLILFYNIGIVFFRETAQFPLANVIVTNAFFISANIIALIALYNIELLERKEFYQRFLLSKKQREIITINQNLESQVKERTKLLNNRNSELEEEIIQRKRVEIKLLESKERAEESDRLKTSFLTNMSHEIRTPMNGILGFIDLLQDSDISKEEHASFLRLVNESSTRLLNTINDILEISKIEAGQTRINYSEFDANGVLDNLYEFFAPEASAKVLALKIEGKESTLLIKTDKIKLESILTNLIKNAIKFTKSGAISFGCIKDDNKIKFFVKDTGIGIPTDRKQAIFNRFEQADNTERRGYEGSGLGLSISKAYVEMLGGKIWLESEESLGSTFYFIIEDGLDQRSEEKLLEREKIEQANSMPNKTILLAEDDQTSITLLKNILALENYNILIAENGIEVLDLLRANPNVDLILMDIKMPLMDGFIATQEIRKFNKEIPIIAQTAFALEGDKEKIIAAGCNYYLTKPIIKNELLRIIRKFVS